MKLITNLRKKTTSLKIANLRRTLRTLSLYILLVCQPLDGLFTYMGVTRWGLIAEGNPIVKSAMANFGIIPGLTAMKLLAMVAVTLLIIYSETLFEKQSIAGEICLCICTWIYILAIGLWIYVLFGATNVTFG